MADELNESPLPLEVEAQLEIRRFTGRSGEGLRRRDDLFTFARLCQPYSTLTFGSTVIAHSASSHSGM